MADFGVTAAGFKPKQQSDIITEIRQSLQSAFGQNINLLPESVFGQIVGIFSEREALIWQLGEAIYDSQYPGGAEGTSVDNILALNNLRRLGATFSRTAPPDSSGNVGLALLGTPGTVIPSGSQISVFGQPTAIFALDQTVTIQAAVNDVQQIFFSSVPDSGAFAIEIIDAFNNELATPSIKFNALDQKTFVGFASVPGSGNFKLVLTRAGAALTTGNIAFNANAAAVQAALVALSGYAAVTVSGSFAAGFTITWGAIAEPLVTITANTLGVAVTPVDSIQAAVNNLYDSTEVIYPYTDVLVTGDFTVGFTASFGAGTVVGSNPVSSAQLQKIFSLLTNTLLTGITAVNLNFVHGTRGTPAQAVGSATATATGPISAPAGTLTVIDTPVSGWDSVTNQLDVIAGTNLENDTDALNRRLTLLASAANGPLQAIAEKVALVSGVSQVKPFENLSVAAQQFVSFSAVPVVGNFSLQIGSLITGNIPYTGTAATVQTAIRALSGYSAALVYGSFSSGFTIDFNGAQGGQAQPLVVPSVNTLGVTIATDYGLPGKAFEIVVVGGETAAIAQAIYGAKPAGIQSWGRQFKTTGNLTTGSNQLASLASVTGVIKGQTVTGFGIPDNTFVLDVVGSVVTMSNDATQNTVGAPVAFDYSYVVLDTRENRHNIAFSRPVQVPIYISIALTTDLTESSPTFNPGSIPTIQSEIVAIGNKVKIGGLIIGFGSDGLIGAFNDVPGIISYTLFFGRSPGPGANTNIQLAPEEVGEFETFLVVVSYT